MMNGFTRDSKHHRVARGGRARLLASIGLGVLVVTAGFSAVRAQQLVGSGGHALDANLRLGSGGYNRTRGGSRFVARHPYAVETTRQRYKGGTTGRTFATQRRYDATGYARNQGGVQMRDHQRFRYEWR